MSAVLNRIAVAIALLATPMTPVARQALVPNFTAEASPDRGLAGSTVKVAFRYTPPPDVGYRAALARIAIESCEFYLDKAADTTFGCTGPAGDATWTMALPAGLRPGPHDVHWTIHYPVGKDTGTDRGFFPFEVVAPTFTAAVEPAAANPGQPVDVRFTGDLPGVTVTGCVVAGVKCGEDGRGWFARVAAPDTTSVVPWTVAYVGEPGTGNTAPGEVEIKVEPWPAPRFQVSLAGSAQVAPGAPVTVRFESLTTGVEVDKCFVTYRGRRVDCTGDDLATLMIPGDAAAGPVDLPWELTYKTSRQGEKGDRRTGSVGFAVRVEAPHFAVTVQPPAARPGDTVALTLTSLAPGVEIADCIVFFPHAAGATCRRSPQHRVVRTRVPPDLQPGATLLRWAVASVDAAGRKGADDDVIAYPILPPLPRTGPSTRATTPATKATTTAPNATTPTTRAAAPPTGTGTGTGTGTEQAATMTGPAPEFVAETRPESAPPGARVTVVVSPLDPAVRIVGCAVVFSGGGDRACRRSGGRWSAQATVPAGAAAGETLPLDWRVTFVDPAGARAGATGTTDYPVRGSAPAAPAFEVVASPPAAPGGKEVTVSHSSADAGVTITGCRAGFTEDALTDCEQSAGGWTARVRVPATMPAGAGPLHWRIVYARVDGPGGAARGFSTFEVLPPERDDHGWRYTAWNLLWRTALGGALLAGLLAFRGIRKPILDRLRPRPAAARADDSEAAPTNDHKTGDDQPGDETVTVVPVPATEQMTVRVGRPDAPPARDVRLRIHRPRLVIHVPEELP